MQLSFLHLLFSFLHLPRNGPVVVVTLLVLMAVPVQAAADDVADYTKTFKETASHLRTATAYLRTGNNDFSAFELEAYLEKWVAFKAGNDDIGGAVSAVRRDVASALELVDAGKPGEARKVLVQVRGRLRDWHRRAGIEVFADCIFDAAKAAKPLWVNRHQRPDLDLEADVTRVNDEARRYQSVLAACNERAPEHVATDQEFRRLIDGSLTSLRRIPSALSDKDNGLVYRLLIELRAFSRLLDFRYG